MMMTEHCGSGFLCCHEVILVSSAGNGKSIIEDQGLALNLSTLSLLLSLLLAVISELQGMARNVHPLKFRQHQKLRRRSLVLDAGCGNGKYLGLNPNCYFIGCDISAPLINICADKGHEVLVADAVNLPYRSGYGDAAISIAVLHHLSTEIRRKKAVEELIRVVKPGGLVLITVWAREQEDKALVNKWTPLNQKYLEEWIGPGSPRVRSSSSSFSLKSIPETEENCAVEQLKDVDEESAEKTPHEITCSNSSDGHSPLDSTNKASSLYQQEYFVPWHLPYHRAEVSGASVNAVANGLARKDDKKGAVVYDRYYHVFSEGELERLVSGVDGSVIVDRFYDKSNWCIILEKTSS
ncbi:UNVERIFIED_CONTAM: tRNA (carboxymethyluridine(34)-5-O)-methyltransferase [Sesamum calycinum]|uniref:tRNA (Carboxymethyluridine(34)-5-O)-methyltransferase n=1 Tax=Sesamum calycinum TaxID=2727403 RepID=A0AAW2QMH9_9LAMI